MPVLIRVPKIGERLVIRVVIVEEMGLLRSALSAVLSNESDVEVLAEVDSVERITGRPDVIVVDLDLTANDALTAVARVRVRLPGAAVLAMSARWSADLLLRAVEAEVLGFVSKDLSPDRFVRLVRLIARGERVIDPRVAAAAFNPPANPLTERERDVLNAAAEGLPPKEIATRLHLAHGTVRNRLSDIMRKTGARNRLEAIRVAREKGWL
ncbi:response regulator transcription factor [Micromonospora sp. CPCC 205371]|nr:response regulator transcription factor [Micromonospora sp. CPCC 205371]